MSNNAKPHAAARGAKSMPTLERALGGRRILLTGATGFLGKTFLYVLLRHHPEVERIYLLIRGDNRSALNYVDGAVDVLRPYGASYVLEMAIELRSRVA